MASSSSAFHSVSEEVLYARSSDIVVLSGRDVDALVADAKLTARRRMRICAHRDVQAPVHEMFIVHERGTYVPPHKHVDRSESFHVVQGRADIIIFNDDGSVRKVIAMGEYSSGLPFYYRLNESHYHTLYIHSENFVFHETGVGPFDRTKSQVAPWAPDEKNDVDVSAFLKRLEEIISENSEVLT